jgi:hypothetical protein
VSGLALTAGIRSVAKNALTAPLFFLAFRRNKGNSLRYSSQRGRKEN